MQGRIFVKMQGTRNVEKFMERAGICRFVVAPRRKWGQLFYKSMRAVVWYLHSIDEFIVVGSGRDEAVE